MRDVEIPLGVARSHADLLEARAAYLAALVDSLVEGVRHLEALDPSAAAAFRGAITARTAPPFRRTKGT